jgi:hypothetical protein
VTFGVERSSRNTYLHLLHVQLKICGPTLFQSGGHATGEFVLKEFARIGRETLRDTDVLLRHGRSLDELIARADSALYVAKNAGRDLVRVADESYLATTAIRRAIRQ